MKSQWNRYQTLELIPESMAYPKGSLLGWLTAPVRRPFANIFVRKLCHKHQVLLFKRCLNMTEIPLNASIETVQAPEQPQHNTQVSSTEQHLTQQQQPLTQQQQFTAQQWLNRGGLPWWTWYDT